MDFRQLLPATPGGKTPFVLLLILLAASPVGAGTPRFDAAFMSFPVGDAPVFLAVSDLDEDGRMDLAVANSGGSTVSLLLSSPAGPMPGSSIPAGSRPAGIVAQDFDLDGHADMAVTNFMNGSITVTHGNGDGSFQEPVTIPLGSNPFRLASADFNGDGFFDVAAPLPDLTEIAVVWNDGHGEFLTPVRVTVPVAPFALATGDLNHDGLSDLLISGRNDSVSCVVMLPGSPDGLGPPVCVHTITLGFLSGTIAAVRVADVDADGLQDLLFSDSYPGRIGIRLAQTDGTLSPPVFHTDGDDVLGILVADVNGDGEPDVMGLHYENNRISVRLGTGGGILGQVASYPTGSRPSDLAVVEITGDDQPDLVTVNLFSGTVGVLEGRDDGRFGGQLDLRLGREMTGGVLGDWNDDGHIDILAGTTNFSGAGELRFFAGNGDGTFKLPLEHAVGFGVESLAAADFSGDGIVDVVTAHEFGNAISVQVSEGDGTFNRGPVFDCGRGPGFVAAGDVNGDGRPDIVTISSWTGTLSLLINRGDGSFTPYREYPVGDEPVHAVVVDFDGDSRADVAVANRRSASVSVYYGRSDGTLTKGPTVDTWSGPRTLRADDVTGDGVPDLVVALERTARISIYPGQSGGFGARLDYRTHVLGWALTTADVDRDSWKDVIVTSPWSGAISVQRNEAGDFEGENTEFGTGTYPIFVEAADLNEDGFPDLVVGRDQDNAIGVMINRSSFEPIPDRPGLSIRAVWPNPARLGTGIRFETTTAVPVRLEVFDVQGRRVRTQEVGPGGRDRLVTWNCRNDSGTLCPAGHYYFRLSAGSVSASSRVVIVR